MDHIERPGMPDGYGISADGDGTLPWSWVEERLTASRNYWICTTRPDGRPHAMPVWGLWLDGAVLFSTDLESAKGRNLTARPDVVVHLESGDEVVVVEGRAERMARDRILAYCDAYDDKYSYRPQPDSDASGCFQVVPERVLAWRESDFPTSATRFRRTLPA